MTSNQRKKISALREQGLGYKAIAKELGLTENCVKKHCQRNHIGGRHFKTASETSSKEGAFCMQCGQPLEIAKTGRPRKFCSDACRMTWWHRHPESLSQKATYLFVCPACGKQFSAYGNSNRKYCSHECYIVSRFSAKAGAAHD